MPTRDLRPDLQQHRQTFRSRQSPGVDREQAVGQLQASAQFRTVGACRGIVGLESIRNTHDSSRRAHAARQRSFDLSRDRNRRSRFAEQGIAQPRPEPHDGRACAQLHLHEALRCQLLLELRDRIDLHDAALAQQRGGQQRRNQHRLHALHEDHVKALAPTSQVQEQQSEEQQRRRYRAPPFALEQPCRREPRDADAVDDCAFAGRSKVAPRRHCDDCALHTHAPRERERLSTLAALIFRMEDLGHQADPHRLHPLSCATATGCRRVAVVECSADASVWFTTKN
jgi:hypothetical protein